MNYEFIIGKFFNTNNGVQTKYIQETVMFQ